MRRREAGGIKDRNQIVLDEATLVAGLAGAAPARIASPLKLRWVFRTGAPIVSSAVIGGGRVFIGSDDGSVYAVDLATARVLWKHRVNREKPYVNEWPTTYFAADGSGVYYENSGMLAKVGR